MSIYIFLKTLHVISAFTLVGPLALAPKWIYLYGNDDGKRALGELHKLTGYSGVFVLTSGLAMLYVGDWQMLYNWWMYIAIAIFAFIQLLDHFWADKLEKRLLLSQSIPIKPLKMWLIVKLLLYLFIASLMLLKP